MVQAPPKPIIGDCCKTAEWSRRIHVRYIMKYRFLHLCHLHQDTVCSRPGGTATNV